MPHLVKIKIENLTYYWFDGSERVDIFRDSNERMEEWVAYYHLPKLNVEQTFESFKMSIPDLEMFQDFKAYIQLNNFKLN